MPPSETLVVESDRAQEWCKQMTAAVNTLKAEAKTLRDMVATRVASSAPLAAKAESHE